MAAPACETPADAPLSGAKRPREDDDADDDAGEPPVKEACPNDGAGPAEIRIGLRVHTPTKEPVMRFASVRGAVLVLYDPEKKTEQEIALAGLRRTVRTPTYLLLHFADTYLSFTCSAHQVKLLPRHEEKIERDMAAHIAEKTRELELDRPLGPRASASARQNRAEAIRADAEHSARHIRDDMIAYLADLQIEALRKFVMAATTVAHLVVSDEAVHFTATYDEVSLIWAITEEPRAIVVEMGPDPSAFYACMLDGLRLVVIAAPYLGRADSDSDGELANDEAAVTLLRADGVRIVLGEMTPSDADALGKALDEGELVTVLIARVPQALIAEKPLALLLPDPAAHVVAFGSSFNAADPAHNLLNDLRIYSNAEADAALEALAKDSEAGSVWDEGEDSYDDDDDSYSEINSDDVRNELNDL